MIYALMMCTYMANQTSVCRFWPDNGVRMDTREVCRSEAARIEESLNTTSQVPIDVTCIERAPTWREAD